MTREEAIERIKARFDKWVLDDRDIKAIQTLIPELKENEEQLETDIEEQDDDSCPICGWALDAAGCCSCCGYGRR